MRRDGRRKKWRPATDPLRFEASFDLGFAAEFASQVPDIERMLACIQCGTCGGTCPLSVYMDHTPRRPIEMTRAGARGDVLGSFAIWVCASCYACTVECPKQIPITEIMHGLRRIAFWEGAHPRRFTNPVMARGLVAMAEGRGRSTESWLAVKMYLKTAPVQLLMHAWTGQRFMRLAARDLAPAEDGVQGEAPVDLVAARIGCYRALSQPERSMEERQAMANGIDGALRAVARRYEGRAQVRHPIDMLVNDVGLERISRSGPRDPPGGKHEGARHDDACAVASIRPGSKGVLI